MNRSSILAIFITIFFSRLALCQISGTVMDNSNGRPIPYVNVWIKNKLIGTTTGEKGKFNIKEAKIGDTLVLSSVGYDKMELPANQQNEILLTQRIEELKEVVVIPMRNTTEHSIESFRKVKKNRAWYNNGFYSLARFYEYKSEYEQTPFVKQISLITNNAKNGNVIFRIRVVKVAHNGEPSDEGMSDNIIVEAQRGVNEALIDLYDEKIIFPKTGLFIVVDRLNLEENKSFNKYAKMDILQPAIGIERTEQKKNTWFGFGGRWFPPLEIKEFLGTNRNIAVNIKLTD